MSFSLRVLHSFSSFVALALLWLGPHMALADDGSGIFAEAKAVGQDILNNLLWLSGFAAVLGFMMAGHAFSAGDIERGKTMLKGTLIGTVCIYGAVGLVSFIRGKFSDGVLQ